MIKTIIAVLIAMGLSSSCGSLIKNQSFEMLIMGDFKSVSVDINIHDSKNQIIIINEKKVVDDLISRINNSKRRDASSVIFEKGPEGLLTFEGQDENEDIQVKFFKDNGDVWYKNYIIDSKLMDIISKFK